MNIFLIVKLLNRYPSLKEGFVTFMTLQVEQCVKLVVEAEADYYVSVNKLEVWIYVLMKGLEVPRDVLLESRNVLKVQMGQSLHVSGNQRSVTAFSILKRLYDSMDRI